MSEVPLYADTDSVHEETLLEKNTVLSSRELGGRISRERERGEREREREKER